MFGTLKAGHKLGAIGARWAKITNVDPGDKGQVAKRATQFMVADDMTPEDAWLTSMVAWMSGMPWPDSKVMLAQAMFRFLDACGDSSAFSADAATNARESAQAIIYNA
jgi:hypothetical protein